MGEMTDYYVPDQAIRPGDIGYEEEEEEEISNDKMVQHHEKYEEIHGEDKIVMMSHSDHKKLHIKLRKEKKCNIPAKELHVIATAGYNRTNQRIRFFDTVAPNIGLVENVLYNNNTGKVQYNSYFEASNGKKLIYVDL